MIKKNIFRALVILTAFAALTSCTVMKRHYMRGFYTGSKSEKTIAVTQKTNDFAKHLRQESIHTIGGNQIACEPNLTSGEAVSFNKQTLVIHVTRPKNFTISKKLLACDTIYLRDGTVIAARVLEIGPRVVKYRYCGGADQEMRFFQKDAIAQITYANGTTEKFETTSSSVNQRPLPAEPQMNGFALAGFILSLIYVPTFVIGLVFGIGGALSGTAVPFAAVLIILGVIFWLLGLIFSITGLIQINRDKLRYKGMALAIIGLILTFIPILAFLKSLLRI